ncbi:MAG: UbiA family prenyltransferase [Bacteroidia bacterium]
MNRNTLLSAYKWLVYGNYWVAAGASALYASSCMLASKPLNYFCLIAIFFATVSVYTYHRVFRFGAKAVEQITERVVWIHDNLIILRIQTIITALAAVGAAYFCVDLRLFLFLIPAVFLAVIYIIPMFPITGRWVSLRSIPMLKSICILLVWLAVTVVPVFSPNSHVFYQSPSFLFQIGHRAFFLFALIIVFDMRDIRFDRLVGLSTFASKWGFTGTKRVANVLLVLSALIAWTAWQMGFWGGSQAVALAISSASSAFMLARLDEHSSDTYYSFWLESCMLDQFFWLQMLG